MVKSRPPEVLFERPRVAHGRSCFPALPLVVVLLAKRRDLEPVSAVRDVRERELGVARVLPRDIHTDARDLINGRRRSKIPARRRCSAEHEIANGATHEHQRVSEAVEVLAQRHDRRGHRQRHRHARQVQGPVSAGSIETQTRPEPLPPPHVGHAADLPFAPRSVPQRGIGRRDTVTALKRSRSIRVAGRDPRAARRRRPRPARRVSAARPRPRRGRCRPRARWRGCRRRCGRPASTRSRPSDRASRGAATTPSAARRSSA